MKVLLTWLLLLSTLTDPGKISKVNTLKKEAQKAYNAGDYTTAIEKYRMLKDSMKVAEDEVTLNLANAYFQKNDTTAALTEYQQISSSTNNAIRSKSNQQIGVLNNRQGKFEEALANFKQAIKADPNNMDARYNYEMLKKKLEEKKKREEERKEKEKNKSNKPSEFAKKLKEQADKLVRQFLFMDAYQLMSDGLKQDQSVSFYQDFIDRLQLITQIDNQK